MKRLLIRKAARVLALSVFAIGVHAQGPAPAPLTVHGLSATVSWVEGGGGNSGVIIGDKGVIIIDAKISQATGKELIDDVAKLTPKPIDTVILSHSDRDHVNGLVAFPANITVIAQENDKKEQQTAIAAGGKDAPSADHLPTQVITKDKERMKVDGVSLELLHWGPAHTSGDLVVYLPKQKVVFAGDILTNRPDPLIHLEKNGSSEGWITTAKGIASLDADTIIPGHGAPETKAQVQKYIADAEAKRTKIKELVAQGKSLEEVKTAVGDPPSTPNANGPTFATYTEVVYKELTRAAKS